MFDKEEKKKVDHKIALKLRPYIVCMTMFKFTPKNQKKCYVVIL